jgi:peptidoglycan/LPS O-acetylase OafA/YrhL
VASIDTLRAVATFGVVLYHSWLITGANRLDGGALRAIVSLGWIGVDVFFVLSGFVHFLPVAKRGSGGLGPWRQYASRRLSRVVPAYYLALITVLILTRTIDWAGLAAHLAFLQVPFFGLSTRTGLRADQPVWTMSIEAAFYVVLPLVAARYVRRPGWWLLGAIVVAMSWKLATRSSGVHWAMQFPSYAAHFALGMTAAWIYVNRKRMQALVRWAIAGQLVSFALFVWFASHFVGTEAIHRFVDNLPMAVAFAAFVLFTALRPRSLRPGPLAFVSQVSYGVYLFHILVIGRLLRFVSPDGSAGAFVKVAALTSVISLAIGYASLRLVETPIRNLARR